MDTGRCRGVPGDTIVKTGKASVPDVLKADTQGFEKQVLQGLGDELSEIKVLLLETWLSRGYGQETPLLPELIAWLDERDFVLVETADDYRNENGFMVSVDAFFLRRDVAVNIGYTF